jgi:hypothetical protein
VDPAEWLANYDRKLARIAANAKVAEQNLKEIGGAATSPRGEVEVRVGPSGSLEDIRLTAAARSMEADRLAALILQTARKAQRAVGLRAVEIMTDYVGEGPATDMVRQNVPPAPQENRGADTRSDDEYFSGAPEVFQ